MVDPAKGRANDDNFYEILDGSIYDKALLKASDEASVDGEIGYEAAKCLWTKVGDENGKVTDVDIRTMDYIMTRHKFERTAMYFIKEAVKLAKQQEKERQKEEGRLTPTKKAPRSPKKSPKKKITRAGEDAYSAVLRITEEIASATSVSQVKRLQRQLEVLSPMKQGAADEEELLGADAAKAVAKKPKAVGKTAKAVGKTLALRRAPQERSPLPAASQEDDHDAEIQWIRRPKVVKVKPDKEAIKAAKAAAKAAKEAAKEAAKAAAKAAKEAAKEAAKADKKTVKKPAKAEDAAHKRPAMKQVVPKGKKAKAADEEDEDEEEEEEEDEDEDEDEDEEEEEESEEDEDEEEVVAAAASPSRKAKPLLKRPASVEATGSPKKTAKKQGRSEAVASPTAKVSDRGKKLASKFIYGGKGKKAPLPAKISWAEEKESKAAASPKKTAPPRGQKKAPAVESKVKNVAVAKRPAAVILDAD